MNYKIYLALKDFAEKKALEPLDKLSAYKSFDDVATEEQNAYCLFLFIKAIEDKGKAREATEIFLSSLQTLLPESCKRDENGKRASLGKTISELKGAFSDELMPEILSYLENCRNQYIHRGVMPSDAPVECLYGEDKEENYYNLACLIIYTAFRCRLIYLPKNKFKRLAVLRYRWRAITPGHYAKVRRLSMMDSWIGLIPMSALRAGALVVCGACVGVGLFVFILCCGLVREFKDIFADDVSFTEMTEDEVKDFVTGLSKPERAYYISMRLECLNLQGNYYRVGNEKKCRADCATDELYRMARRQLLPNAHNAWGILTLTTIGFCKTPILKITSHIPSGHRYLKARKFGEDRESVGAELYDIREKYLSCNVIVRSAKGDAGYNRLKRFASTLAKKYRAEYLIITNPDPGTKSGVAAKSALTSAGIKSDMIKTIYSESIDTDYAVVNVHILL